MRSRPLSFWLGFVVNNLPWNRPFHLLPICLPIAEAGKPKHCNPRTPLQIGFWTWPSLWQSECWLQIWKSEVMERIGRCNVCCFCWQKRPQRSCLFSDRESSRPGALVSSTVRAKRQGSGELVCTSQVRHGSKAKCGSKSFLISDEQIS